MRRSWVFVVVLAVGGVGATGYYAARMVGRDPPESQGRIIHAEPRAIDSVVNATGTIRLRVGSEVRVGSQLSGIVKTLNVTVGSHVRAGDVIAEIDDRPLQARLADATAQVEMDQATLERAEVNYRRAQELASVTW